MPRLRRSDIRGAGIGRRRRGRGFSYTWSTGDAVTDPEVLARITALAIPPAWQHVWISPWPHGHIQAVGTDAAGRRQYRYHDDWRRRRDQEKFVRALAFGRALPQLRASVDADLAAPGLGKRRVLAAGVRLLDIGGFRLGGEEYAEDHGTFGVATLRKDHVRLQQGRLVFDYPAKGSIPRHLVVDDPAVREVVGALRRRRGGGDELLAWKQEGGWVDVRGVDINAYLKQGAGPQFSAKDFRTWSATVYAAVVLANENPGHSGRSRQRAVSSAVKEVAGFLGNTPAVCRASYIDPRVIDRYEAGETVAAALERLGHPVDRPALMRGVEDAVIDLIAGPATSEGVPGVAA